MRWFSFAVLYTALAFSANAALADTASLVALRQGDMKKLIFHAEPKPVSDAPFIGEGGAEQTLADFAGQYVLLNFWATWCAPCREELPALIAAARTEGVALLAVTDEPWPLVVRHFDGEVPPGVVRDITGGAATDWRVPALPDTYAVVHGRIVARVGGARDWNTPGARRFLADLRGER